MNASTANGHRFGIPSFFDSIVSCDRNTILFIGALCLLLNASFLLGPYAPVRVHDTFDSIIAKDVITSRAAGAHWIPQIACGVDTAVNRIHQRIPSSLYAFLPIWLAYGILCLSNFILMGAGTFYFAGRCCNLGRGASLLAAVAAISVSAEKLNQFSVFLGLFPFVLVYFEKLKDHPASFASMLKAALFGGVFGLCASFPIFSPFAGAASLMWFLLFPPHRKAAFWAHFAIFWMAVVLVNLDTVIAILSLSADLHRVDTKISFLGTGTYEMFKGAFFGEGWLPFFFLGGVLLLGASERGRMARRAFAFYCLVAILLPAASAVLSHPSLWIGVGFGRIFLTKYAAIGVLFGLVYTAFADSLLPKAKEAFFAVFLGLSLVACLFLVWLNYLGNMPTSFAAIRNSVANVTRAIESHAGATSSEGVPSPVFRVAWQPAHPSYANLLGVETLGGYTEAYAVRYKHFWERVITPPGEACIPYFKFWGNRIYLFDDSFSLGMLSFANARYVVADHPLPMSELQLIHAGKSGAPELNTQGADSLASKVAVRLRHVLDGAVRDYAVGNDYYVYFNKAAFDRFFVPAGIKEFDGIEPLFDAMRASGDDELVRTLYIESGRDVSVDPDVAADIRTVAYTPDVIDLDVQMSGRGVLVITNQYSKYWKCTANGEAVEVIPAYGAFQGVQLQSGRNVVHLYYDPPWAVL